MNGRYGDRRFALAGAQATIGSYGTPLASGGGTDFRLLQLFYPVERLCAGSEGPWVLSECRTASNSYEVTDLDHPDFHVTGTLRSDGTLTISMLRANNKRAKMEANLGQVLGRILEHFPNRRAIEIKLSQNDRLDSHLHSREPLLEAFNQAWKKNKGESEAVRLTRAVQAVPELKQISDALGKTVKIEFSSYTQAIVSRRAGKTTDPGYLRLGLRLEAQPASEKQKP